MNFATLTVIMIAALLGPLLASHEQAHVPVIAGQLLAGILLGPTVFGVLNAADPTLRFLADIGFALIMFVAGSHVPVRTLSGRGDLGGGALRGAAVAVLAAAAGFGLSALFHTGHMPIYTVLMASSSAAVILPIVGSLRLGGPAVTALLPQVAIADTLCIVALPLVIDPGHAARAALGTLLVLVAGVLLFLMLRTVERSGQRKRLHKFSERRRFALELRISLTGLFAMAALAQSTHVSYMLAGFAAGLAVAGVGEPRRLARQLFAVTEGFFGPVFFVWLGSSLDLRDLWLHPSGIALGVLLGFGAVLVHIAMRFTGQPISLGALAAAQLGVPVAAATVGNQAGVLAPGESAAFLLGALITVAAAVFAGGAAARAGLVSSPEKGAIESG